MMAEVNLLPQEHYNRPTLEVARSLLGCRLIRLEPDGTRVGGWISETEAYIGTADQACHARHGRTDRNESMWGPPGHSYVYFTYGMHWLLNAVTERDGFPAAVLLRAIVPAEGKEIIESRRGHMPPESWTDGPAKLCQALSINGQQDGQDLCSPDSPLQIHQDITVPDKAVTRGPRVGLNNVPEPWHSKPWRFRVSHETMNQLSNGDGVQ
ncbi:MAG: DNA-3-methyladenine glycosylase [Anaerolineales bacterium]